MTTVTQSIDDFGGIDQVNKAMTDRKKHAAFIDWQYKLKRGDKLPRGKYFKDKRAGRPRFIMDEAHKFLNH